MPVWSNQPACKHRTQLLMKFDGHLALADKFLEKKVKWTCVVLCAGKINNNHNTQRHFVPNDCSWICIFSCSMRESESCPRCFFIPHTLFFHNKASARVKSTAHHPSVADRLWLMHHNSLPQSCRLWMKTLWIIKRSLLAILKAQTP